MFQFDLKGNRACRGGIFRFLAGLIVAFQYKPARGGSLQNGSHLFLGRYRFGRHLSSRGADKWVQNDDHGFSPWRIVEFNAPFGRN